MIEAVSGYPGSGKSLYLTYRSYREIKKGRMVFSSFPLKGAYKITFDDLVNYSFPEGSIVVIDESGRWFNSRNWSKLPPEVFDLFTLHRHAQLTLLIAVQNFNRIDVALREVVEIVHWAVNDWWLPYFKYYTYYDVEEVGGLKEYVSVDRVFRWTRARDLYDTHIMKSIFDSKEKIPAVPWSENDVIDERKHKRYLRQQKFKTWLSGLKPTKKKKVISK